MSALEEIQSAIEKLTELRDSPDDQWLALDSDVVLGDPNDPVEAYPIIAECESEVDAELIVTLHRTIDAQLAILFIGGENASFNASCGAQYVGPTLALARAINGTA